MAPLPDNPERWLESANGRLAELLHTEPLRLVTGGAEAAADTLWVWGVLGGKDVGKSTLINALAGGEVVRSSGRADEGTFMPAAYLAAPDLEPFRGRLAHLGGLHVDFRADAPETMRGLTLVDLPDFDSLFADHTEQVRRIAGVLDGIIWVTTPKKIGDLRSILEVQRVLKDRANFVYVVNKMDWLLTQTAGPPLAELDRVSAALRLQMEAAGSAADAGRSFLVSARYREPPAILEAIARGRSVADAGQLAGANGELSRAVDRLAQDFTALRGALTTAPTAEAARSNKQANLAYQSRVQAAQLLQHHRPRAVLERLERIAGDELVEEAAARCFPQAYCRDLLERINCDSRLVPEWSGRLFRRRIVYWPLVGLIAWPLAAVGAALGGLRRRSPGSTGPGDGDDLFRADGIPLEERSDALLAAVRAALAGVTRQVAIDLPKADAVAAAFRTELLALAEEQRSAAIARALRRRPSLPGRLLRWLLPVGVVLWFPLVQPVLAGVLEHRPEGSVPDLELLAAVVHALSAHHVLAGLGVSLLILAAVAAGVYARAVRDAQGAAERLADADPAELADTLMPALLHPLRRPIEELRRQLAETTALLERLAAG